MNKLLTILALGSLIFISSCGGNNKVTKEPIQDIPVIKVTKYDVPIYNSYVGQIYGQKDIPIRARVEGFLESIEFTEGSRVKKGQLLYTIDPKSLEAASNTQKSKVSEAETRLSKARSDLDRIKPLAEANAVSKSDLDAAQAAYDAAISNLKAAKSVLKSSHIDLSYTKVLSPINGIIGKTNARVGEFVGRDPNPVILNTVSKTDTVIVKFSVTESQYLTLAKKHIANKKLHNNPDIKAVDSLQLELADGSIYDHNGIIDFVDRNINEQTGSILVQASFPNPDGLLRPGLYSKVKVQTDLKKGAIVVPSRCLKELQGQYSVYVVTDSNTIENRPVVVSNTIVDLAIVTDGLSPNDRVVIDAIQKVAEGMKINPIDSDFKTKLKTKKQ